MYMVLSSTRIHIFLNRGFFIQIKKSAKTIFNVFLTMVDFLDYMFKGKLHPSKSKDIFATSLA